MGGSSSVRAGPVLHGWVQFCRGGSRTEGVGPVLQGWVQFCMGGSSSAWVGPVLQGEGSPLCVRTEDQQISDWATLERAKIHPSERGGNCICGATALPGSAPTTWHCAESERGRRDSRTSGEDMWEGREQAGESEGERGKPRGQPCGEG